MKRGFTLVEVMVVLSIIGLLVAAFLPAVIKYTKTGRGAYNTQMYGVQKVDDATRYATRKDVEDTCRTMVASYKSDVATINVYRKSGKDEWAEQVVIRANRTAESYNEFVRKNSFVFQGNVPSDIDIELKLIQ